jgi:hypothetical protein
MIDGESDGDGEPRGNGGRGKGEVRIDRLALDVPGLTLADASRLATRVAAHLARAGAMAGDIAIPRLEVVLSAPDTDLDRLAWRIASAVLRAG